MLKLFALVLLLVGCEENPFKRSDPKPDTMVEKRAELNGVFQDRLHSIDWVNGIPSHTDCDGGVWAGVAAIGGVATHLEDFFYPAKGQSQRRTVEPCWPNDRNGDGKPDSASTTSNDGITAKAFGLYEQGKTQILNDLVDYGRSNDWFMGDPSNRIGEVVLKFNQQIVLQRSVGRLPKTPTIYTKVTQDFEYHIQVLNIAWEGRVEGSLSKNALNRLDAAVDAIPSDYLFNAVRGCYNGDLQPAVDLLLAGINPSSYVRAGAQAEPSAQANFEMANWLAAAKIALDCSK